MISIVNGYISTSSCEVVSAKQGKDPSTPPGSPPGVSGKDRTSALARQPATVLDGALANTNAVTPADSVQQSRLDRLA